MQYKMNEIVNKFLLAGDTFIPEMHLKQPGFIYKNELDKACFQHDISYRDFKDLLRKTASDKVLRDKAFNIAENPKYDEYQVGLASMVYKFFDKKSASPADKSASGGAIKNENMSNEELAEELHKPIIRKFKKTSSVLIISKLCLWCASCRYAINH